MDTLVTPFGTFQLYRFEAEKDFEIAVISQADHIFGDRFTLL